MKEKFEEEVHKLLELGAWAKISIREVVELGPQPFWGSCWGGSLLEANFES